MALGSPKCIQGEFRIFFKKVYFYFHISSLLAHFLQEFWTFYAKNETPKWPNLVYGKPWKTVILRIFQFLMALIILGCPKCIQGKFKTYLKNFEMCFIFSSLLGHFVKGFWIFEVSNHLKMAQYCVVWKILKKSKFWQNFSFWSLQWFWDAQNSLSV